CASDVFDISLKEFITDFQYAVFKVRMQNRMLEPVWKACFPKQVSIFDFIACLHATERTTSLRCIR
ncbi:UNVERIFIED_ORG: hypothetical protein B5F06_16495, partial [Lacrimispora saccharolytica]